MNDPEILAQAEKISASWRDYQFKKTYFRNKRERIAWIILALVAVIGIVGVFYPRAFYLVVNSRQFNTVGLLVLIGLAAYGVYYRIFNPKLSLEDRKFLAIAKGDWQTLETLNSVRKHRSFKESYPLWIRIYIYGMGGFALVIALWCAFVYLAGW